MGTSVSCSSKCHLSDGKLRPIVVHVFTIISGTKRWFSQVASPCTTPTQVQRQWPWSPKPKAFLHATSDSFSLDLVTLWALMSLKTSWVSTFSRPSEEGKWNNAPKLRRCFFQWLNWALPPATFRLTIKPTLKWRGQLATAQFSSDKAESWTAAPPGDLHIWFTQKVTAWALKRIFTGILLQHKELPQNIYSVFSNSFLGMATRIWKENITLSVILLSEKTIWILASWMLGELRWHFRYFYGLLTLICCGSPWVFPEDIPEAIFW